MGASILRQVWIRALIVIWLVIFVANSALIAVAYGILPNPWAPKPIEGPRATGDALIRAFRLRLEPLDDQSRGRLESVLQGIRDSIHASTEPEDVARAVSEASPLFHQKHYEAVAESARRRIVEVIGSAARDGRHEGKRIVSIWTGPSRGGESISVDGADGLLLTDHIRAIEEIAAESGLAEVIDVRVDGRHAFLVTPATTYEKVVAIRGENARLLERIHEIRRFAGAEGISGPGLVLMAYDRPGGYLNHEIVHDGDIRTIVNLLMDGGARGVEVGGERIVVGSSIRCAGPVVLVNGRPIAVNPVTIKAIGDTDDLVEPLLSISTEWELSGKALSFEAYDQMTLSSSDGSKDLW